MACEAVRFQQTVQHPRSGPTYIKCMMMIRSENECEMTLRLLVEMVLYKVYVEAC